jgi:streptomycin 6-kinase
VTGFELPAHLARSLADDADPARRAWLSALPAIVADLAAQWELELGPPFQPGGSVSWVAPARRADGARVVLKAGWRHPEAEHEAAGLRCWDGNGAVRVLAESRRADTLALLLERCEPGAALASRPEPETDAVVCAVLRRLWREVPAAATFPSLASMCATWAGEYAAEAAAAVATGELQPPDPGIVRAGLDLFRTLPASAGGPPVLLATDLHAMNILSARRQPWLAIDPKPHVGDPTYDLLQHMINCTRLRTEPEALISRLAGLAGVDQARLRLWTFARCVQGAALRPDLVEVAVRLAP